MEFCRNCEKLKRINGSQWNRGGIEPMARADGSSRWLRVVGSSRLRAGFLRALLHSVLLFKARGPEMFNIGDDDEDESVL